MGKKSRDKGKRFERYCAKHVLPKLTGHPHWKRTQRGDTQHRGDLIPCDAEGKEVALKNSYEIVECKTRAKLPVSEIKAWTKDLDAESGNWLLIFKQDHGPVFFMESFFTLNQTAQIFGMEGQANEM